MGRVYTNTGGPGPDFPTLSEGYRRPCPCRACLCGVRSSTSAVDGDLIGLILVQAPDRVGEAFAVLALARVVNCCEAIGGTGLNIYLCSKYSIITRIRIAIGLSIVRRYLFNTFLCLCLPRRDHILHRIHVHLEHGSFSFISTHLGGVGNSVPRH